MTSVEYLPNMRLGYPRSRENHSCLGASFRSFESHWPTSRLPDLGSFGLYILTFSPLKSDRSRSQSWNEHTPCTIFDLLKSVPHHTRSQPSALTVMHSWDLAALAHTVFANSDGSLRAIFRSHMFVFQSSRWSCGKVVWWSTYETHSRWPFFPGM